MREQPNTYQHFSSSATAAVGSVDPERVSQGPLHPAERRALLYLWYPLSYNVHTSEIPPDTLLSLFPSLVSLSLFSFFTCIRCDSGLKVRYAGYEFIDSLPGSAHPTLRVLPFRFRC